MNSKVLLAVAAILAALAIVFFKAGKPGPEQETATAAPRASAAAAKTASEPATATAPPSKKTREVAENEALVAEYGDSRTTLSKHVTTNLVALLDDIVAMGEMAASGEMNAFGGRRASLRGAMGPVLERLNLDDTQREKAEEIHRQFQQRELARTKQNIDKVRSNPTPLMKLILASDAAAEGKITDEAFKQVQAESSTELTDILNPLDQRNFGRSRPLEDEKFTSELREILTPEQVAALDESQETAPDAPATENTLANIQPMTIEKMDQAVSSGKKVTSGLRQMMEGMGSLQELGPLPGVP